jgi:hypothetical protein
MYGYSYGRFTSPDDFTNDSHVSDPQSWNLYVYVRNNPLRLIDPTGTIIEDKNGNVKTKKRKDNDDSVVRINGKDYFAFVSVDDNGKTYAVVWKVQKVWVFADDGTKIKAYKAKGDIQLLDMSQVSKNQNGSLSAAKGALMDSSQSNAVLERLAPDSAPFSNVADCHGTTFAKGQVWINDSEVPKLMTGDGYDINNPTSNPQPGDIGIYTTTGKVEYSEDANGNPRGVVHSVIVNSTNSQGVTDVVSKGGITNKVNRPPGPGRGTAWERPAQVLYFPKKVKQ